VTVKDQDGKEVFSKQKEYGVYDLHFTENKEGYIGLNDWDITAMDHVDLGLHPLETDSSTFVIPLSGDTKSVDVKASFSYNYEEGRSMSIHTVTEKVDFTK
jgi:hypothetical protein